MFDLCARRLSVGEGDGEVMSERPVVVIVDDESDIADSLHDLLHDELHIEALTATSPEEGFGILQSLEPSPPALLMVDFRMPRIDGIQFLQRARAMYPGLPAIMITAYADLDLVVRAANNLGVARFLRKPLHAATVVEAVQDIVSLHWRGRQRQAAFARTVHAVH